MVVNHSLRRTFIINIKLEKQMSNTTTGTYDIGPPSDYMAGHALIGTTLFIEAALPIILYYAW